MIYTQSRTLYEKIPKASRSNFTVPPSGKDSHAEDGMIGSADTHTSTASDPAPSSEIHVVSYEKGKSDKQPGSKKKGKAKKKKNSPQQEDHLTNNLEILGNLVTLA